MSDRTSEEIAIVAAIRGAVYANDDEALYILARRLIAAKADSSEQGLSAFVQIGLHCRNEKEMIEKAVVRALADVVTTIQPPLRDGDQIHIQSWRGRT